LGQSQLVGHRGVVQLPKGFIYHDNDTLKASREVAEYAKTYEVVEAHKIAQNKIIALQSNHLSSNKKPVFRGSSGKLGKELLDTEILAFEDSRRFDPPFENRMNVKLPEVEKERENGKIRLLPGEGVIPSQRYAEKTSNRFEGLSSEESERARNRGETVFDDGLNETKVKYQYKSRPILGEYFDKYYGKQSKTSLKETPRTRPIQPQSFANSFATPTPTPELLYPNPPVFNPSFNNYHTIPGHYSYLVNHR